MSQDPNPPSQQQTATTGGAPDYSLLSSDHPIWATSTNNQPSAPDSQPVAPPAFLAADASDALLEANQQTLDLAQHHENHAEAMHHLLDSLTPLPEPARSLEYDRAWGTPNPDARDFALAHAVVSSVGNALITTIQSSLAECVTQQKHPIAIVQDLMRELSEVAGMGAEVQGLEARSGLFPVGAADMLTNFGIGDARRRRAVEDARLAAQVQPAAPVQASPLVAQAAQPVRQRLTKWKPPPPGAEVMSPAPRPVEPIPVDEELGLM